MFNICTPSSYSHDPTERLCDFFHSDISLTWSRTTHWELQVLACICTVYLSEFKVCELRILSLKSLDHGAPLHSCMHTKLNLLLFAKTFRLCHSTFCSPLLSTHLLVKLELMLRTFFLTVNCKLWTFSFNDMWNMKLWLSCCLSLHSKFKRELF